MVQKKDGGRMKTKSRTEITIETHRILVIRAASNPDKGWCERCGRPTARISLQAATQERITTEAISRHVDEAAFTSRIPAMDRSSASQTQQLKKGIYSNENHNEKLR